MILINETDVPVYNGDLNGKVLYLETQEQSALMVVSFGSHPCCYITFPGIQHLSNYDDANDLCDVHGGFTFLGSHKKLGIDGVWLGWDYAHYGDLLYFELLDCSMPDDHKWSLEELIIEARKALSEITSRKGEL